MSESTDYYVPGASYWPIIVATALFIIFGGGSHLQCGFRRSAILVVGFVMLGVVFFGWFGDVIKESENGVYSDQVDVSFRMGMSWFIFSEVMFFAAFFGALYYARMYSVLGWGEGSGAATNEFPWPEFTTAWPLFEPPSPTLLTVSKKLLELVG